MYIQTNVKSLTAILLIALLFFNWYGYRIITGYIQKQADQQLAVQLDNHHYDESQLIELKVELRVPYQTQDADFERHYGEIEIDGKSYTYVKRKMENGFLILKCIPNHQRDKLKTANTDFLKMVVGLNHEKNNGKQNMPSLSLKNFWSEYSNQFCTWNIQLINAHKTLYDLTPASALSTITFPPAHQPPKSNLSPNC